MGKDNPLAHLDLVAGGEAAVPRSGIRWVVVGLLLASAAISYLDRVCMGVAAPKIQEEFGLTNTEIGMIIGLFQWGYVAAYIPAGLW